MVFVKNRAFRIIVALACFAALSQLAVQAQIITVSDGANTGRLRPDGASTVVGGTAGITIDAAGSPVEIIGATTVDTAFAANIGGAAGTQFTVAPGTGNTGIGGTLGVTGATTIENALTANNGGAAGTQFTVAAGTGNTAIGGTLGVTGATTVNAAFTANNAGAAGTHFTVAAGTGNTAIGGTLGVTGATTLTGLLAANAGATVNGGALIANGGETVINGSAIYSGAAVGLGNRMIVDAASSRFVSADGTQSVAVDNAGTLITGAAGHTVSVNGATTQINGTASIFSGTGALTDNRMVVSGAVAGIGSQFSGLSVLSASNSVSLFSDTDLLGTNARAALNMSPTSATLLVNTNAGVPHGLEIYQTSTVLSGGTNSTDLILSDAGATFQNTVTGGPAKVTGVADGVAPFDAVNVRQFDAGIQKMSSGIASVAALAAIPGPVGGKNYSAGLGFGNYNGRSAVAVGVKANLPKSNISVAAGAGFSSNSSTTANAGVSFSF